VTGLRGPNVVTVPRSPNTMTAPYGLAVAEPTVEQAPASRSGGSGRSGRARRDRARLPLDPAVRWLVRGLWVALPFTAGPVLADALADASRPMQVVASAGLWLGWATGVVASFVALPVAVTALRTVAPAGLVAVMAAAVAGHQSALALGWAGVATAWVFAPIWSARCVNGPAYPNERRFLLRAPGPLLLGGLVLAWGLAVAGLAAGPLLLAARRWVIGGILTAVGLPVAGLLLRGLHELSRRWVVFVPAGIVLHDPITLVDPILLRRQSISRLGPAIPGRDALDLTQRAPGLALQLTLEEEVTLTLLRPGRRLGDAVKTRRLLVTPTRPGALLDEARRRRLPVG
jgi:hypothetical protein